MGQLQGQVAIVTGAAQGLGRAFARRLRDEGCEVVMTDRRASVLDAAAEIGATGHVGDVADASHVRSVAEAQFDRVFGSNTKGAFLFGRAVAPTMASGGGGNIVNISTDHVKPCPTCDRHHGHGGMDLYNASKWALNGLTFDWAKSLKPKGIRVNNICMGATDTEMLRGFIGREPDPEYLATWMKPEQTAQILVELLEEGPSGRTANSIGLYAGSPCVMPPPE